MRARSESEAPAKSATPSSGSPVRPGLNRSQQAHLLGGLRHLDELLKTIRDIPTATRDPAALPGSPTPTNELDEAALRDEAEKGRLSLLAALEFIDIDLPSPNAAYLVRVTVQFARIAVFECRPKRLAAYGPVTPEDAARLEARLDALSEVLDRLEAAASQQML